MSEIRKPLSILLIECSREVAEDLFSELGLTDWRADTCGDAHGAVEVLRGQKHYDLILTTYEETAPDELELLREVHALDHRKRTPVMMVDRKVKPA